MDEQITDFINFLYKKKNYDYYLYPENYSHITDINREKIFIEMVSRQWLEYNFYVVYSITYYIKKLEFEISEYKDYEPIFLKLLYDMVIHNADNIRYDLTIRIIFNFDYLVVINYLEKHGLIYLLSRINPNTLDFRTYPHQKKAAECIYDHKLALKKAWLGAVAKASM